MAAVSNRINTLLLVLVLLALLALIGMVATGVRGGPLDPPGAPGSTDSVKLPGTPISSLPYTISEPGTYYLTRNLTSLSGDGITINADNVTLDLMGFALDGPAVDNGESGITDLGVSRANITLRNGTVRYWHRGVNLGSSGRSNLDDLRVFDSVFGITIGSGGVMSRLVARDNEVYGIRIQQHLNDYGTDLRDSVISRNAQTGVWVDANNVWIHDNVIDANGFGFASGGVMLFNNASWNKVTDNRIAGNGGYGVRIDDANGGGAPNANLVARNAILGNTPDAVLDTGTGNRIGTFVGVDASVTNPWSNVVY